MSYFATTFLAAFIKPQKHLVLIERNLFQTRAFSVAGCCVRDRFNGVNIADRNPTCKLSKKKSYELEHSSISFNPGCPTVYSIFLDLLVRCLEKKCSQMETCSDLPWNEVKSP